MTTPAKRGKVWLVGAGPGDPGLLTIKGKRAIENCDVLLYDALVSPAVAGMALATCERIYVGKRAGTHSLSQADITALMVRLGGAGKRVVRLKGGDPFVFARGGEEAQALHAAGIPFEIVPGVSSALAAPAYAGIPVTHRDHNTTFTVSTGHEDPAKGTSSLDFAKLANPRATTIFLMAMRNLSGIVAELRTNGLAGETPVAIIREATKPTQETLVATLDTIVVEAERARFAAPAIVVVGSVVRERPSIRWFDSGPLFGKRVLITRPGTLADAFAMQLWEAGAEPILAPTIAIGPPDDATPAAHAVAHVRDYAWVAFTSRHGVDAFFERLHGAGKDARALGDVRVAAIGPATAAALAEYGIAVDFMPSVYVNESVAAGLLERTAPGERVLLFRAQEAREVLPQMLRDDGRRVDAVAAYRTRFVDDPGLRAKVEAADIVTFTSSSTVQGLVYNLSDAPRLLLRKLVAAIGPVTAKTALGLGIRVDAIPDEYTLDGLLGVIEALTA